MRIKWIINESKSQYRNSENISFLFLKSVSESFEEVDNGILGGVNQDMSVIYTLKRHMKKYFNAIHDGVK